MILLDMDDMLKTDDIWKCNQCHACVAHCPQDVRFADIVRALREISIKKGYRNQDLLDSIKKLDDETKRVRLEKIKEILA